MRQYKDKRNDVIILVPEDDVKKIKRLEGDKRYIRYFKLGE